MGGLACLHRCCSASLIIVIAEQSSSAQSSEASYKSVARAHERHSAKSVLFPFAKPVPTRGIIERPDCFQLKNLHFIYEERPVCMHTSTRYQEMYYT